MILMRQLKEQVVAFRSWLFCIECACSRVVECFHRRIYFLDYGVRAVMYIVYLVIFNYLFVIDKTTTTSSSKSSSSKSSTVRQQQQPTTPVGRRKDDWRNDRDILIVSTIYVLFLLFLVSSLKCYLNVEI